ncbi:MAG TPA: NUDIX hydrolase [Anaerolineae bacterium]|nr:NUDIX hydrolase [Anaerolineae bacterium]
MDREYPSAPAPSVGAVVFKGDRVLLVLRGQEPSRGRWSIPGGVMELGETIQETARREVREECGVQIEVGNVVEARDAIVYDEGGRIRFHYVLVDVVARYLDGELTVGSDAEDARWVSKEELPTYDLTKGLLSVLKRCLHRRNLDFPEHTS